MLGKYFFRCTVCNDIHVGRYPPKICPTCGAVMAFVSIDEKEAGVMLAFLERNEGKTFTKEEILRALTELTSHQDFVLNPDKERVELLMMGMVENETNHGLKYCPCRMTTENFEEDLKLVCPCNFKIQKVWREQGECWCSLFVRRKNES